MEITLFTIGEINDDVRRIETVLATNIFTAADSDHPLATAALTEVMICLNDLLQKTKDLGFPVTFTDDVPIIGKVKDVTDLVNHHRNALCHIPSPLHYLEDNIRIGRIVIRFQKGGGMLIGNAPITSDYDDDICFIFGKFKIYFFRHILRAFIEAKFNLTVLVGFSAFPQFVALQMPELVPLSLELANQSGKYQ